MIDIAKLTKGRSLQGNYFSPDAYLQGDVEFGLLENRSGSRLIALPDTLLQGLYIALENQIGQGSSSVLYNCGRWWGKSFYRRFREELGEYYGKPVEQMEMAEFLQCLKQCWKTHGWGTLDIDLNYYQQGFLVIKNHHSAFAEFAPKNHGRACFIEAGLLSAFFSQLSGQDLKCVQISCESLGDDCNSFVIGLEERLKSVSLWLEEGHDHATVMELLCCNQSAST